MDRISKALELSRRSKGRRPQAGRSGYEPEKHITYSQTRVVTLNSETLQQHRVISDSGDQSIIEAYKLLRTRVLHRMLQNRWVSLGITSAGPNTGKTLTAINLAISLAMKQNYTVVLVDADLRRPSIHKYLGIEPEAGLRDCLSDGIPIEDVMLHPRIDRLVVVPGRGSSSESGELLASPRMSAIVQDLKTRYPGRLVLFDLPPVLVGDDVVAFSPHLDATMLIVEDGGTQTAEFEKTLELLEGSNLIGTVLNKSDEKRHGGDYEYYY